MRLWSIHPKHLDPAGLVALWREGLLAQKVLAGQTRGYRHHPQLDRFRDYDGAISAYLRVVSDEASRRGYAFDATKIASHDDVPRIAVTRGQIAHEWSHLRAKLQTRNAHAFAAIEHLVRPRAHPLFYAVAGGVAEWERRIVE
jgi:hypothetical protein